jgi:hypothetical protein
MGKPRPGRHAICVRVHDILISELRSSLTGLVSGLQGQSPELAHKGHLITYTGAAEALQDLDES